MNKKIEVLLTVIDYVYFILLGLCIFGVLACLWIGGLRLYQISMIVGMVSTVLKMMFNECVDNKLYNNDIYE